MWLLTQDSKASAFTRLLFAMRPWYASEPRQLGGPRVASVIDPITVSRAWALQNLLDAPGSAEIPSRRPRSGCARNVPWLGRLWGDGLIRLESLAVSSEALDWSRTDPDGLYSRRPIPRRQAAARRKPGTLND